MPCLHRSRFFLAVAGVALFATPLLSAHSPMPFNIQPFAMEAAIPPVQVLVYQVQPPLKAEWQRASLPSLVRRPTLLLYGLIGDSLSLQAAEALLKEAKRYKRIGTILVFRGVDEGEIERVRSWVAQTHPQIPVVIDATLELAFGLLALQLPSYAILDEGGVLKVRRIRGMERKLLNRKTLADTLEEIEKGKPIPTSDGEYVENTLTLVGQKAPTVSFTASQVTPGLPPVSLSYPLKKPVLLVFWMATCPHCQKEMPRIAEWWRRHKEEVELITVTRTTTPEMKERTQSYLRERGLTDLPVYEATDALFAAFRVEGIPTWAVIRRSGEIVEAQIGEDPRLLEHLDAALKKCR